MQAIERMKAALELARASGSSAVPMNPEIVSEVLAHIDALEAENERLRKDAERYRFIRDADRSDCIWREICIYAMETLDEYVDAAMDGEATMKGTP